MNKVWLSGYIDDAIQSGTSKNGKKYAKTLITVMSDIPSFSGNYEYDTIKITAWGDTAEKMIQNCKEGTFVELCGSIRARSYESKYGTSGVSFEVSASLVNILGGMGKETEKQTQKEIEEEFNYKDASDQINEDFLPF